MPPAQWGTEPTHVTTVDTVASACLNIPDVQLGAVVTQVLPETKKAAAEHFKQTDGVAGLHESQLLAEHVEQTPEATKKPSLQVVQAEAPLSEQRRQLAGVHEAQATNDDIVAFAVRYP